jgi:hypothetical protein
MGQRQCAAEFRIGYRVFYCPTQRIAIKRYAGTISIEALDIVVHSRPVLGT